ncbi:hypothetical protein HPB51_024186 [Rhipicephalus microplus]|uniref:Hydroxysteroid 17-beta dehydrogenase 11 n=1 Tax=Rhipicephalus microplus TaxID=6941 RepID=A0A9J6DWV7_RHIMP|nr:hypothetical protein HPB51_024186 [Rhipicephalus microplus]
MEGSGNKVWHIAYNLLLVLYYIAEAIVVKLVPRKYLQRKSVSGETVLVTGAGSGIGRLLSLRFAQRGARLVLWDIDRAGNEETARLIREAGGKAWPYVCNVAESKTVYETAAKVREDVGRVDIVVNNAGVVTGKRLLDLPDELIARTFQINTLSHYWPVREPGAASRIRLKEAQHEVREALAAKRPSCFEEWKEIATLGSG